MRLLWHPYQRPTRAIAALGALVMSISLVGCTTTTGGSDIGTGTSDLTPAEPRDRDARNRAQVQTQLGIGYLREGQAQKALNRLRTATRTDPTYAPAHNALGSLYEQLRQPEQAGQHFKRATELDPTFAAARNNYGGWLCRAKRYDEAEHEFRRAAENPLYDVPQLALFNAGVCAQKRGDTAAATRYFRGSLQRDPRFAQSLFAMSEISFADNNALSARAYLQRYLEVGKHTPRTLWLGIRIERELNDKNAVSSYAMLLKSKFPTSRQTRELLESERQ